MKIQPIIIGVVLSSLSFLAGCKNDASDKKLKDEAKVADVQNMQLEQNRKEIDRLNHDYPKIPVEGRILESGMNSCYEELEHRYKQHLEELKKKVEATGAKFAVVMMAMETGKATSGGLAARYGNPFIKSTCEQLGIETFDFAPVIASQNIMEITQLPKDGHFSKKGTKLIADHVSVLIKKYQDAAATVTYKDSERPETFGDLAPNDDEVLDGGKDLSYHVKANAQGLRMDHDLTFPKKKKRVLMMGDSGLFCPFLDNEFTISYMVQNELPDFEVYSVAQVNWTLEDYLSLWNEKTKYTEPDIVVIFTNPSDIEDYFFTNRNHCSRSNKPFPPSPTEEKFYRDIYHQ